MKLVTGHRRSNPFQGTERDPRPLARSLRAGLLSATVAAAACNKEEPNAEAKSPAPSSDPAEAAAPPPAAAPATAVAPATPLQRGNVLLHVLVPNPSVLLGKIGSQLMLPMVSEALLRAQLSQQLGQQSAVAQGIDFTRPLGCAMLEIESWSCVVGYKGGVDKLISDLGDEGKQPDPAGHAAHFKIDHEDMYLDGLGDTVVLSSRPDAFGSTKTYLESNLISRASKLASDIEAVAYPAEGMKRYQKQIQPFLDLMSQTPPVSGSGNPKLDKVLQSWNAYGQQSNREQVKRFGEMQQLSVGIALEQAGIVARAAVFATAGSRLQRESQAQVAAFDSKLLGKLPASSWLVFGSAEDSTKTSQTQTAKEVRSLVAQSYADLVGKDAAKAETAMAEFMAQHAKRYANDTVVAVAHEPDTLGGVIVLQPLRDGSARDAWKAWAAMFTPGNILDEEARKLVTWSFMSDVSKVESVPVDRWIIEPGPQAKAEFEKQADRSSREVVDKLGGLRFVVDRAEVDGNAIYVFAPRFEEAYMKAAITAVRGKASLANNGALATVLGRAQSGGSGAGALDIQRTLAWARAVLPAKQTQRIPPNLGGALTDVYGWWAFTDEGATTGELVISQPFINQLRALAPM